MKKTLLILLVLSSSFLAFSQGTWTTRDTLPNDSNAMFQGISGFSINGYGYAGLGQNSYHNLTAFWQFDPSTNMWTRKADFPGSARIAPASFVIGDKAYLVTGSVSNGRACVTECWEYDATNNMWTQKANFPSTARVYAVGFAIDSLGYVGTGANELNDFRKDFYAYHPSTNTWTRIADLGGIARSGASAFAVNGKGYVCFGQDSTIKYYGDMWEYDPVANSWTRRANLPGDTLTPHFLASGFAICNNIYLGSGIDSAFRWCHEFWKYNTVTNTWTQQASPPGKTKVEGAAFAIGDTGYYGFGWDSLGIVHCNIFDKFYAGDSCNITTSDAIASQYSSINIFPNPSNGMFSINYSTSGSASQKRVEIFNSLGVKVYETKLNQVMNDFEVNLGKQPSGVYILSFHLANQTFYKKLIINH